MTRYIWGLDPAERVDFFGACCHRLEDDAEMPQLQTLRALRDFSYPDLEWTIWNDWFVRFPPSRVVVDYTNERSFSDRLTRRLGEYRVEPLVFTLANKLRLKKEGYTILQRGYKFPDLQRIRDPKLRALVEQLISQLKHEQRETTPSGKTSFGHPEGEHNDEAIAWELSIHGCFHFLAGQNSYFTAAINRRA